MYDVKQHRIVFLIKEKEKVKGAIGRGLNSQIYPKWYIYGDKTYPFICGDSDIGILVEDCASACAVSHVYSGIALMGTSLPDSFIPILKKKFKKIIVALDRDATTKSFDISNQLRYYVESEVKILEDDLKYYDEETIKKILA
jgi:DNA primase